MTGGEMVVLLIVYSLAVLGIGFALGFVFTVVSLARQAQKQQDENMKHLTNLYPTNPEDAEKWKEGQEKLDPSDEGWLRRVLNIGKKKDNDKDKK